LKGKRQLQRDDLHGKNRAGGGKVGSVLIEVASGWQKGGTKQDHCYWTDRRGEPCAMRNILNREKVSRTGEGRGGAAKPKAGSTPRGGYGTAGGAGGCLA